MSENEKLLPAGNLTTNLLIKAAKVCPTPFYLYDEKIITEKCRELLSMPNAFGLAVRYAMKANSSKALLQLVYGLGCAIDASSLNEVRRAFMAGIPYNKILYTTQEVPAGKDRTELQSMMLEGLEYNVCSLRQLQLVADFACHHKLKLSMRVHPGVGSGESSTRNTGDKYSCFGVHRLDIKKAMDYAAAKSIVFKRVHVHIGSGADPVIWRQNIDRELKFVRQFFPDATIINFGGGLKEARMPEENKANIEDLGNYAVKRIKEFNNKTGRELLTEIEPGTYAIANAGFLVTQVLDIKQTGRDGFEFIVTDGGMEVNARPLLYGSRHPFYLVSQHGNLLSSDFQTQSAENILRPRVIVGRCCESGDSQTLSELGHIVPRNMALAQVGDYVVIGGCGAYCSAMTPYNYNSHVQVAEVLLRSNGQLKTIRNTQTLDQVIQNELPLN